MAESNYSWWKLTFLRKKKSTPKVLILASDNPEIYVTSNQENQRENVLAADGGSSDSSDREFNSRLEKIVDKNTKGRHVKVSHSGRFKEKKKVRATLSENPNFFADGDEKWRVGKREMPVNTPSFEGFSLTTKRRLCINLLMSINEVNEGPLGIPELGPYFHLVKEGSDENELYYCYSFLI